MICHKCGGRWGTKVVQGHLRSVCTLCGYIDPRMGWEDGVYTGPPELLIEAQKYETPSTFDSPPHKKQGE